MEGFTMTIEKEKTEEQKKLDSLLDKGLDDISAEERQKKREERRERREERSERSHERRIEDRRSRSRRDERDERGEREHHRREKVVEVRISRSNVEKLAKDFGVDTKGYNIHLEAVLTPRRH